MSNQHAHGAFGAQLLGSRNLTPHTSAMSFTPSVDVAEDTGFSPLGGHKTYLQGLGGSAASSSGYFVNDYEFVVKEMRHLTGNLRDNEALTMAWFGCDLGKFVTMARARKTEYNVPVSNSSVITTSINHQCDSIYWDGHSLWNPFGIQAYSGGAVQSLVFDNADINQFFALHFQGETESDIFPFQTAITNAALKSGIDGLLAAMGVDATVTVTGSLTGTDTKTGTKTLTFSGTSQIPPLEVITGAVRRLLVAGGDTGNYTWNGGANFTLGVTESALQTNQRALGVQHMAVVVKGNSTAPSAGVYTASGFPNNSYNGAYSPVSGSSNGEPFRANANGRYLIKNGPAEWFFVASDPGLGLPAQYASNSNSDPTIGPYGPNNGTVTGGSTVGVADFVAYYPVNAAPTAPTATGTGSTTITLVAAGSHPQTITQVTVSEGGSTSSIWNLITANGVGAVHDSQILISPYTSTSTGFYARLQVLFGVGTALVVLVEHSDSPTTGYSTLCTFNSVTNSSDEALTTQEFTAPANTVVKRYVRARVTSITGTYAFFVGYSRFA